MNFRSRALLDLAHHLPCQWCGRGTASEPAHSNQQKHGKGMSLKLHDCYARRRTGSAGMKTMGSGSMKVEIKLCVLQESEIRKAAALIARFHEVATREPDAPDTEFMAALYAAINAAAIALHGADDEQ